MTIVPDHETRKQLRNHEMLDFERRQKAVDQGRRDPGRQLPVEPELKVNFEFISSHRVFFPMPTPAWARSFIHDSKGVTQPYPIQDRALLVYPLILAAYQPLFRPSLILPPQREVARAEVTELVDLYNRRIVRLRPEPPNVVTSQPFQVDLEIVDCHYPVRNTTSIQESPRDEMEATGEGLGEEPGQPTSLHTSTNGTQSQIKAKSLIEVETKVFSRGGRSCGYPRSTLYLVALECSQVGIW